MKIAQKLGLLVAAFLVTILTTILVLSAQISTTSKQYDDLIGNQIAQSVQARNLLVLFGRQVQNFQQILLQSTTSKEFTDLKKDYTAQFNAVRKQIDALIAKVGPDDPRLRTTLLEFKTSHAAVSTQFQAALDGFKSSNYKDIQGASGAVRGQESFPNDLVTYIVDYRQRSADALIAQQRSAVSLRLKFIYAISALLLLVAAGAVTLVVRGIVNPVRSLTAAALDAANTRLPRVVAQIATLPAAAPPPSLPKFEVTTRDELGDLATALTTLQDSAVDLAMEQRRNEEANAETLVNLGRRNQSLLTRMLSYVTELERDERDSEVLDKLFRLDHLTTRIRRNAESLLVLAGAKQTRTWSQPIAMQDVLRAALSEIEEYTRVTVHHAEHAQVHGGVAADLTHLLAELLENATRFSPRENQVLVVGRLTPSGYQFDVVDSGLGMDSEELTEANDRISNANQRRPDTKVLGHHVVGQIAARRGIFVQLLPSEPAGITAQVLVPASLLSDAVIPATFRDMTPVPPISAAPQPQPALSAQVTQLPPAPIPITSSPSPAYQSSGYSGNGNGNGRGNGNQGPSYPSPPPPPQQQPAQLPQRTSWPSAAPDLVPVASAAPRAGRRVRGAQLGDLGEPEYQQQPPVRADASVVRSQMSALQNGVAAARSDFRPQPIPENPVTNENSSNAPIPIRRVRGAQLAELGAEITPEDAVPVRDPAATGRALSGLQAATNQARQDAGQYVANGDDTFGRNA